MRQELAELGGEIRKLSRSSPLRDAVKNRPARLRNVDLTTAFALPPDEQLLAFRWLSYREILDRYGPPDKIFANGCRVSWEYELGEGQYVVFQFQDGYVVLATS